VDVKRSSHAGLGFDTCANAGCHNYHDNRALYETFFVDNASSPWLKTKAVIVPPNAAAHTAGDSLNAHPEFKSTELPLSTNANHWDDNLHIQKGIACSSCHLSSDQASEQWLTKPAIKQCQQCHLKEAKGFKLGRHGMRLPYKMAAAKPSDSRMLEFDKSMSSVEHDCVACHQKNSFGTRFAATQACLGCHKDEHSKAFPTSPHALIEASNESSHGSATVDCATCHMPRVSTSGSGNLISVEHNQSLYLRPNEKMIRPVCMACHGLAFSIDALADLNLIRNNFSGRPSRHVPSIDWALKRKASKKTKNKLQK
jgi:hypothetical protein